MSSSPYSHFPDPQFWSRGILRTNPEAVQFDCGKKFDFSASDRFATAGSCFARHFANALTDQGGTVLRTESAHPLHSAKEAGSYHVYSARYGNIYTNRQLRELLEQALGKREMVEEFAIDSNGKYQDMLRPGASPCGFSSVDEARADRRYHLGCVRQMLEQMDVFVFTMGLTEGWVNSDFDYVYPVCPGTALGEYSEKSHRFVNFGLDQCVSDLREAIALIHSVNPAARLLLTVSPVGLVATAETRSVAVSSALSKSVLRVCAEQLINEFSFVDYFPSYEVVTSPASAGRFWAPDRREVTSEGVAFVMRQFFRSRMGGLDGVRQDDIAIDSAAETVALDSSITELLDSECEEILLDKQGM